MRATYQLLHFVATSTSSIHTLALVRPGGSGSDRVNALIDKLLPGQDKLKTININADQVDSTLKNGDADAAIIFPADFAQQVSTQQGVPGDAVLWPEREVSSLPSLFPRLQPQAAQARYLIRYLIITINLEVQICKTM